jgi:membrane dipeptidase
LRKPLSELQEGPFTLEKARLAQVRLFCTALYCADRFNGAASLGHFKEVLEFTRNHFDQINMIEKAADIKELEENSDLVGTIFLVENADMLAGNLAYAEALKQEGIRIIGLTHAGRNRLADGNGITYSAGLTREGTEVVRALQEHRLLIDVSHLHPACFWELMRVHEGPLIASHAGIRARHDIPRNIDLDQARQIHEREGVVGITFHPEMLSPDGKAGIQEVFAHLDTLVQCFGPELVAIGSDFCGFDLTCEGIEDVSGLTRLKEMMLGYGYGNAATKAIMGLNWLRIYKSLF